MLLLLLLVQRAVCPDEAAQDDQRHSGHDHHAVVLIPAAVLHIPASGDNVEAEQCAEAEELTDKTYDNQHKGVAQTVTDTIKE